MVKSLKESKKSSGSKIFTQIPFIWWKIVKIGPVDRNIIWVRLKKVKEEITEGKIYSLVGKFAERAN